MQVHQDHQLSLAHLQPPQIQKEKQKLKANKGVHKPQKFHEKNQYSTQIESSRYPQRFVKTVFPYIEPQLGHRQNPSKS